MSSVHQQHLDPPVAFRFQAHVRLYHDGDEQQVEFEGICGGGVVFSIHLLIWNLLGSCWESG